MWVFFKLLMASLISAFLLPSIFLGLFCLIVYLSRSFNGAFNFFLVCVNRNARGYLYHMSFCCTDDLRVRFGFEQVNGLLYEGERITRQVEKFSSIWLRWGWPLLVQEKPVVLLELTSCLRRWMTWKLGTTKYVFYWFYVKNIYIYIFFFFSFILFLMFWASNVCPRCLQTSLLCCRIWKPLSLMVMGRKRGI